MHTHTHRYITFAPSRPSAIQAPTALIATHITTRLHPTPLKNTCTLTTTSNSCLDHLPSAQQPLPTHTSTKMQAVAPLRASSRPAVQPKGISRKSIAPRAILQRMQGLLAPKPEVSVLPARGQAGVCRG